VYSREQLMSLASSPLVKQPLQLKNGAQGIPPEIARRGDGGLECSPTKSSIRGQAMRNHAQATGQLGLQHQGGENVGLGQRSPLGRSAGGDGRGRSSRQTSSSSRWRGGDDENDATFTTSDLENDAPSRASAGVKASKARGGAFTASAGGSDPLGSESRKTSSSGVLAKGGEDERGSTTAMTDRRRGRDRQPRVSLGSLGAGAAGQPTAAPLPLPIGLASSNGFSMLPMDVDDPFGGPAGAEDGKGGAAEYAGLSGGRVKMLRGGGASSKSRVSRHERGFSNGTASSLASGPPSGRSSFSTEGPFVMEL